MDIITYIKIFKIQANLICKMVLSAGEQTWLWRKLAYKDERSDDSRLCKAFSQIYLISYGAEI